MKRLLLLTAFYCLNSNSLFADPEIVPVERDGSTVYRVVDSTSGNVMGIFWDQATGTSDYGFSVAGGVEPQMLWSQDKSYVAVNGGAPRAREVFIYQVTPTTFTPVTLTLLSDEQAAPFRALSDNLAATATTAERWQADGTLLLHFWVAERVSSESQAQREANVWAFMTLSGTNGKIESTTLTKPTNAGP